MTPAELKSKRHALGLTGGAFAHMVGVAGDRTVRKWEQGERDIPGPVIVLMELAEAVPEARDWLLKKVERV